MAKKHTTKNLKKEVDRLNREYKREDKGSLVRFGFGKRTREGKPDTYYITLREAGRKDRRKDFNGYSVYNDNFHLLSENTDIEKVIKDARTKEFKKRSKEEAAQLYDYVFEKKLEKRDARWVRRALKKEKKAYEKGKMRYPND